MKKLLTIITLVIGLTTGFAKGVDPGQAITINYSKGKSEFSFKADKSLLGATVQVFTAEGDLVISRPLDKRKMTIEFGEGNKGTYTIRVVKGDAEMEYQFENN